MTLLLLDLPSQIPKQREEGGMLHYHQVVVDIQAPDMVSTDILVDRAHYCLAGLKVPPSLTLFYWEGEY